MVDFPAFRYSTIEIHEIDNAGFPQAWGFLGRLAERAHRLAMAAALGRFPSGFPICMQQNDSADR